MNQRHREQRHRVQRDQTTVESGSKLCQWYLYSERDVLPQYGHHHALWRCNADQTKGIRRHKVQSAQGWKQGWACTPCSLLLDITWRNRRKAVHNIMLVEDLCATPFLQGRWKCSENLSKSWEFLWRISQQNLSKCAPQSERGPAGLKRLLIGYSKLRLCRWTSQLFRLGLFRIRCS